MAPNCRRQAYTFDIRIFFNDMWTELWSGGEDTDMTRATKDFVDIITTGLDFDIGHANIFHWETSFY